MLDFLCIQGAMITIMCLTRKGDRLSFVFAWLFSIVYSVSRFFV